MSKKSIFITVLSWILIVFTGFGVFISIMQNIMVNLMFEEHNMQSSTNDFSSFMFANMNIIILLTGLLILFSFISALGLLKRKEWARKSYIGLFSFGILYFLSTMIFQWFFTNNIFGNFHSPKTEFDTMFIIIQIFTIFFTIGMCVLFAWLINRLVSYRIKEEFAPKSIKTN